MRKLYSIITKSTPKSSISNITETWSKTDFVPRCTYQRRRKRRRNKLNFKNSTGFLNQRISSCNDQILELFFMSFYYITWLMQVKEIQIVQFRRTSFRLVLLDGITKKYTVPVFLIPTTWGSRLLCSFDIR